MAERPMMHNTTAAANTNATPLNSLSNTSNSRSVANATTTVLGNNSALFREIHKNTWLKRLSADGKKITVGPKKSERSWVVFCVHDDSQALLEGYAEPRQAASHNPEWVVSMQETQHISHSLMPNSHEFEFVVTLCNEVVRFHAASWEIMQEWVETLRSKLREMKILSPRENLYTKLPELRAPLLPTRDPTSPLPATPPVPAALVPGVERIIPASVLNASQMTNTTIVSTITTTTTNTLTNSLQTATNSVATVAFETTAAISATSPATKTITSTATTTQASQEPPTPPLTSMSNTLTQNLLNMLSDPIAAYSEQLQEIDSGNELNLSDTNFDTIAVADAVLDLETTISETHEDKTSGRASNYIGARDIQLCAASCSTAVQEQLTSKQLLNRPHTSRSLSAGAADSTRKQLVNIAPAPASSSRQRYISNSNSNITELQIHSACEPQHKTTRYVTPKLIPEEESNQNLSTDGLRSNVTIIQVSNDEKDVEQKNLKAKTLTEAAEVFQFPEEHNRNITTQHVEFKSNVEIHPSNATGSTIKVLSHSRSASNSPYAAPAKKKDSYGIDNSKTAARTLLTPSLPGSHLENHEISGTVLVGKCSSAAVYGTCYTRVPAMDEVTIEGNAFRSCNTSPKKIILSTNTSGVTNISVNEQVKPLEPSSSSTSEANSSVFKEVERYEKVFLSTSTKLVPNTGELKIPATIAPKTLPESKISLELDRSLQLNSSELVSHSLPSSPTLNSAERMELTKIKIQSSLSSQPEARESAIQARTARQLPQGSPALQAKRLLTKASPTHKIAPSKLPQLQMSPRLLTRGLTEAVITARPSRRDFCQKKLTSVATNTENRGSSINNNRDLSAMAVANSAETRQRAHSPAMLQEQRKRSSSTSDAHHQKALRAANNNELPLNSNRGGSGSSGTASGNAGIQQPPHPFRSIENGAHGTSGMVGSGAAPQNASSAKRMTLREQQVMQLRREIMHPGGVRLQLRRKDCVGSIAWVDGFGAIWIAGWKQKEHPVLYNALHIGDQLISIAGVSVSSAAEANKVIRNSNTLFVEVLIRRIPFGRGYAIRRDREGQCLGLIRDGNTATIVDVVPNSLAARHGLPPKAQSCDGSSLTFWVLTEINGRPLNLFFKDNEIRDRLNSVGRDISILVQPADLIVKLKKQIKSLRGYKDYLVQ